MNQTPGHDNLVAGRTANKARHNDQSGRGTADERGWSEVSVSEYIEGYAHTLLRIGRCMMSDMTERRLAVILGAGASHNCGDVDTVSRINDEYRPPLAKDIFARRFDGILNRFPTITARLDEQVQSFRGMAILKRYFEGYWNLLRVSRGFGPCNFPISS